ncbi:MAG: Endoribonuclease YbeY [Candidatus Gallionella acididurans]|uniref:Endoribonuclease YbeY n=1 Tax=Candidatus Gallionella acididurans TaxID=1796491 RepID=A0A139BX77_9PROT|nr:MAG: Endoribonuclease YbeY [Candidatus Gallionella acididurans]
MSNRLTLAVQYASAVAELPTRAQFRRWVKIALQRDLVVTLRVVDEAEGRELNKNYRGKDYATNVLTFFYDGAGSGDSGPLSGDVVICAPVVMKEACAQKKNILAHYAHLTIHAILHLQGYLHESDGEAAAMETLETALMLKLNYPDPYQASQN